MAVLFKAGDQVPVIALVEVVGNALKTSPEQIGDTDAKLGITFGFTVMVKVLVIAHCPAVGVKIYVVVAVLFKAGDHVPVIPLREVVGNGDKAAPEQIAATVAKVGVTIGFTVILNVVDVAHTPVVGVKV